MEEAVKPASIIPINEEKFDRIPMSADKQLTWKGRMSSAGQIVVPAEIRNDEKYPLPVGCFVEVQIKAMHKPVKRGK